MVKMNFPVLWWKWTVECISTTTAFMIVNGSPTDKFSFERELRQVIRFHLFYFC